jgi:hypothetical protein
VSRLLYSAALVGAGLAVAAGASALAAVDAATAGARLIAAYPEHLAGVDGNWLVWKDGTRMAIDDGRGPKQPEALLAAPDIKDMFHWPYPTGRAAAAPALDEDPGRPRHKAFFDKMYGDCTKGEVARSLVEIEWLPQKTRQRLKVTRINSVAQRLQAVSRELDRLPASFDRYLFPAAGTYNCRPIAGTTRPSVHGAGIAIDISLRHAHYWRWSKPDGAGRYTFRNSIPPEIVSIFEKHGFIWGGRWYHYDTMHFEYRPEMLGGGR